MVLEKITYYINGRKKIINAKICNTILLKAAGLMFKKKSPPLLFIFKKEKSLSIHSLFCRPFRAVWLDENMSATKIVDVKNWRFNITGYGRYLLEIPINPEKMINRRRKFNRDNRKV